MVNPESRIKLKVVAEIRALLVFYQFVRTLGAVMPRTRRIKPAVFADTHISIAGNARHAPADRKFCLYRFTAFPAHGDHTNPFDQNRAITYSISMFSAHQDIPQSDLFKFIETNQVIHSLDFSGLEFRDRDFSGKTFYGCRFSRSVFSAVTLDRCRFRMCFFDFAHFSRCSIKGSDIQFSSFAGAHINDSSFENSDLLHDNFNGLLSGNNSFNDSDLYNSRFVMATLKDTSFQNCNLKKTMFFQTTRERVNFKSSNTREAIFGKGENPE